MKRMVFLKVLMMKDNKYSAKEKVTDKIAIEEKGT